MGVTRAQIVAEVMRNLPTQEGIVMRPPPDIEARINRMCEQMAVDLIGTPKQNYLEKQYTLAFVNSIAPLTATELVLEGLHDLRVTAHAENFSFYPDQYSMEGGSDLTTGRWTIEGTNLIARANPAVGTTSGTVRGMFVPVVTADGVSTTLPSRLIPLLVSMVIADFMAMNGGRQPSEG